MTDDLKRLQLEIGGSFFELIEFSLTRRIRGKPMKGIYGVNVAKVREVVRMPRINPLSSRVRGIAGVFELRGIPIPAVHLSVALGDVEMEPTGSQQIIVTEFSQKRAGFIVDSTHRIRRVAWDKVLPPTADIGTCINGMTLIDDNEFLFILDLERILLTLEYGNMATTQAQQFNAFNIGQQQMAAPGQAPTAAARVADVDANAPCILLVDDSAFIRNGVRQALGRAGYRVIEAGDGADGFAQLERSLEDPSARIDLIVSDVEMPRMDGLSFTKKVREHETFKLIPVILHTSLSGKANQAAGNAVGANAYVVKNDFATLLEIVKELIGGSGADALSA